jgi:hypothetical protein
VLEALIDVGHRTRDGRSEFPPITISLRDVDYDGVNVAVQAILAAAGVLPGAT